MKTLRNLHNEEKFIVNAKLATFAGQKVKRVGQLWMDKVKQWRKATISGVGSGYIKFQKSSGLLTD